MFKKMTVKLGKWTAALALRVGRRSVSVACSGPYYQPEVPEKMKDIK